MCATIRTGRQEAARSGALECVLLQCGGEDGRLKLEGRDSGGGTLREGGREGGKEGVREGGR